MSFASCPKHHPLPPALARIEEILSCRQGTQRRGPGRKPGKRSDLGLYLTARDAFSLKNADPKVMLIDIRPRAEVAATGMPSLADANIPYITPASEGEAAPRGRDAFDREFLEEMGRLMADRGLGWHTTIVLICRAGAMAARAANLLAGAGYRKVFTVVDGFEGDRAGSGPLMGQRLVNGWKNSRLPWVYPYHAGPRGRRAA